MVDIILGAIESYLPMEQIVKEKGLIVQNVGSVNSLHGSDLFIKSKKEAGFKERGFNRGVLGDIIILIKWREILY